MSNETAHHEQINEPEKREKPAFLYHGTNVQNIEEFEPRKRLIPGGANEDVPQRVYAGDNPAFVAAHSFPWMTGEGFDLSFNDAGEVTFRVPKQFRERLQQRVYVYKVPSGQFALTSGEGTGHTYHSENNVKPVACQTFETVQEAIEHFGGKVEYYDVS